ncbi:beta-ketoacyl synthase chain length factor [Fluviicola sp.]|uniref:beta-ketoacyl synthase chain length factor n=1 Tax=Fluviicola sp. TaxID=1917219 RepID=UPI0031DDB974
MYIKDLYAISPQKTHDLSFENGDWQVLNEYIYKAIEPSYQDLIPNAQLRRMGKAVRMGIGVSLPLLGRNPKPDGIIFGTANGGLEDCIKFLNQIVEYNEGTLTPTNFVQSTPNALAGQVALLSENQGYNMTHVNGSLAFESALMDASLYFDEHSGTEKNLLLGAVEEISDYNYNIDRLGERFKEELVSNEELLNSGTKGSYCGEGSTQFYLSSNPENSLARFSAFKQSSHLSPDEIQAFVIDFLEENNLQRKDIDCLLLGKSGDVNTDSWYEEVEPLFENTPVVYFKKSVGEYRTVSAFASYLAVRLLNGQAKHLLQNQATGIPRTILIYNHFDAVRHSLILIQK